MSFGITRLIFEIFIFIFSKKLHRTARQLYLFMYLFGYYFQKSHIHSNQIRRLFGKGAFTYQINTKP